MSLCAATLTGPRRFARVSILVYSTKGVLLLEKTYAVDIDVPGEAEKAPPAPGPDAGVPPRDNGPQERPAPTDPDAEKTELQTVIPLPAQDTDPGAKPGGATNE